MATTYDGALGTTVNVFPRGASVSVGFDSTLVLIGATDSGTASFGEAVFLSSINDAEDAFGEDSSLAAAYAAASANGAATVYGVAVDSTASSPDYAGAAQAAMDVDPRYIYVDSVDAAPVTEVHTVVTTRATDLDFARVWAPITEQVDPSATSPYTPRANDQRLVEVAPQSATVAGKSTYTAAAVAGHAARQPLGASIALDDIFVDSLGTEYRGSQATNFEDVVAVTREDKVVDGVTTSTEDAFSDIFQVEIVDTVALGLEEVAQNYAGDAPNTEEERNNLKSDMRTFLGSLADQRPPLLADAGGGQPYAVDPSLGASDDQVLVDVGINPVDVMKDIVINLNVGRTITYDGAEAQ